MKKLFTMSIIACIAITTMAQGIKGPGSITYFQAPSEGVQFAKADVFLQYDAELDKIKMEQQQAKNSATGSKFGAVGSAVANVANAAMSAMSVMSKATKEFEDEEGRFAVWDFVPAYIIAEAKTTKAVKVEIFVMNEPNPSPSASMPTTADKNGYYDIPYYVNCRYKVTDPSGTVVLEENLGVLQGKQKTKDYTPPPPATAGSMVTVTVEEEDAEMPIQDQIGLNIAYNEARKQIFARYGFGQFTAPIKLGVIKEIKASKKLIKPTLAIFEGKEGLLLSKDDKVAVKKFVDIIEKDIKLTTDKTRWVAYHNLSVCYAWLENPEKAKEYYVKYGEEIAPTLLKMECWNKILAGEMKSKEMKEKCGTTFVGTKDQKKYSQFNNVNSFVNFYAAGAVKYDKLFQVINRDLKKFVTYYAYNDIFCQLFEIDYPYQFFPLNGFEGLPKGMEGQITIEGKEPIDFEVKFDNKKRIKELTTGQITLLEDGKKEKLISRDIMPQYKDDGSFSHVETDAGSWGYDYDAIGYWSALNYVYDPLLKKTRAKANNVTKKAGFYGGKESEESVQLKVDLDGNIFFTGKSRYFKANAFYKDLLKNAGIVAKSPYTSTSFSTEANINEQGMMTNWRWEGNVTTNIGSKKDLKAEPMVRGIKFVDVDDKGNPKLVEYEYSIDGAIHIEGDLIKAKWDMKDYLNSFVKELKTTLPADVAAAAALIPDMGELPKDRKEPDVKANAFSFDANGLWECKFTYDAQGNWTEMQVGPITAKRTFKY